MAQTILHKAETRGHANHGWLDSHHTFSFADYYEPSRMHFGALRVLNDDIVAGDKGFGTHPHQNMEIISIPLRGALEHRDSMGNVQIIRENDVQVMSAGSGIMHSEYNKNTDEEVNFLQIWIFPHQRNVQPRYGQVHFNPEDRHNKLQQILSPSPDDEGVWIHQDAWFFWIDMDADFSTSYSLKDPENGVYAFVLEGDIHINDTLLHTRDGLGIWETDSFAISAQSNARLLLMEVPLLA